MNPPVVSIELRDLRFSGRHGLYIEERKKGNEFIVNVSVSFYPTHAITKLAHTINYARVYELLKTEMQQPRDLLETFAMEFTDLVHDRFPEVKRVEISIAKFHPPITGFSGSVGVRYVKEFF